MKLERIKINSHFTYKKIIGISLPTILGIFCWTLSIFIDGILASNILGNQSFQAYSFIASYLSIFYAIAYMPCYAAFNILSKSLGENKKEDADKQFFTMLIMSIGLGLVLIALCMGLMRPVLVLLNASGEVLDKAFELGIFASIGIFFFTIYNFLKDVDYISEKRGRSLIVTIIVEALHVLLSFILIKFTNLGIKGFGIGLIVAWGLASIYYAFSYFKKNDSLLQLKVSKISFKLMLDSLTISLPSFLVDVATGVVTLLATFQAYRYFQDLGGTANGIAFEVFSMLVNCGSGLVLAVMPVFSYNLGAKNDNEIKSLFRKSIHILLILGISLTILIEALAGVICKAYVNVSSDGYTFVCKVLRIYVLSTTLSYLNFFFSSYLISIGKKKEAYIATLLRDIVLWPTLLYVLPLIFRNGIFIWTALIFTDVIMFVVDFILIKKSKSNVNSRC